MTALVNPTPSLTVRPTVAVASDVPDGVDAIGVPVTADGDLPTELATMGFDRARLDALGFTGAKGDALVFPSASGAVVIAVGVGRPSPATDLRSVAAAFARAAGSLQNLALHVDGLEGAGAPATVAEALVEGVLLSRYCYPVLKTGETEPPVTGFTLVTATAADDEGDDGWAAGAARGRHLAAATALARDLASTPHNHLSASRFADLARLLGPDAGLDVEVFDRDALVEMRMAGLLAVNAGSVEPPRLIKLTYRPDGRDESTGSIAFVGKGIMYDSGGISIKPSDAVHAQMKNDMSGAAAVFAAMMALRDLGCTTTVTGYLMCTDNMPSGSATALGDVITYRDGTTVEILDIDAEGRLVLADGLILSREQGVDAVVDIATLTGSAMRALGKDMSALFANDDALAAQVDAAAEASGELVWRLPLHRPYRADLDSLTADMMNCAPIGKPDAIIASLYLAHFVGDVPWAHVDICGPAQADGPAGVKVPGCTGWGARLLAHIALGFNR